MVYDRDRGTSRLASAPHRHASCHQPQPPLYCPNERGPRATAACSRSLHPQQPHSRQAHVWSRRVASRSSTTRAHPTCNAALLSQQHLGDTRDKGGLIFAWSSARRTAAACRRRKIAQTTATPSGSARCCSPVGRAPRRVELLLNGFVAAACAVQPASRRRVSRRSGLRWGPGTSRRTWRYARSAASPAAATRSSASSFC